MGDDRVIESERVVLGTIIANNEFIIKSMDVLSPNDFYKTSHQLIYKAMLHMYKNTGNFDVALICNKLRKYIDSNVLTVSEITEISLIEEKSTFNEHLKIIKEASNQRLLEKLCKEIISSDKPSNDKVAYIQNCMMGICSTDKEDKVITMADAVEHTIEQIEKAYQSGKGFTGIETGIRELDKALNGFERGTMNIIGGRPSMGKTAFTLELLKGIEANVLYVQLDMTIDGMIQRLLASDTQIENRRVGRGTLDSKEWDKLAKSIAFYSNKNNLFFYSPKNPTISKILMKAKEIKLKHGLDVIIIDHIGKIKSETKGTRYEQITAISGNLKRMALDLDVNMTVLCQLNRGVETRDNKRPTLSDLRDAGTIEEDADNIGMLYRDGYYKARKGSPIETDELELTLLKVRNGMLGTIKFDYNLKTQQLIQIIN